MVFQDKRLASNLKGVRQMQVHCLISSIFILFLSVSIALGQESKSATDINKVAVKNGNIYFSADGKNQEQLTNTGKDRSPVLSPDKKSIVFIRKSDRKVYLVTGDGDYSTKEHFADQLWTIDINDKKEKMLVKDWNPDIDDPNRNLNVPDILTKVISTIYDDSPQFSPDGNRIYFRTDAWSTSGAIHSVNMDGTNEHFVVAGNSLEVINSGRFKGDLIVQQHRYFAGCGSYDWFWLFSPDGGKKGPLGAKLERDCLDMDSTFTPSPLKPKRHTTNADPLKSAQNALIEILNLSNSSPEIHKALWIDLDKDGNKDEFLASYTLGNCDYVAVCDITSEADRLLFYKRRLGGELEIRHLILDDKPFILVYTRAGSGGFLNYTLYKYTGIGKLQKAYSEESLFQGQIYLGKNCLYRKASSKAFKLTYNNEKFELREYKQRLEADPYTGTHVITYDWDEKKGLIISFDHEKVTFNKSSDSRHLYSSNIYKVRTDDVIFIDDNMVGKQPHGIKTLTSYGDFHFIQGFFIGYKPAKVGILEFSIISINGHLLRINAVEPQECQVEKSSINK